ncbi:uncharacterized protein LOC136072146 isoform X2 [Hydra vulgaris]
MKTVKTFSQQIPKNQIFSPVSNENWIDIGGLKRDMLVFPAQTLVSLYQKPTSEFLSDHRMPSALFFDDQLLKPSQASYRFLNSAKSTFPSYNSQYSANQDTDLINTMELNGANRLLYDDPIPSEYKDMQGLQDSEEMLVGKIVGNAPKGTSLTKPISQHFSPFHASSLSASLYNENSNNIHNSLNNGLLEKILAPHLSSQLGMKLQEEEYIKPSKQFKHGMQDALLKPQKEINCDPVQLSEVANCTNSMDPLCKDEDLNSFRSNGLHQHQTFRRVHQTPPLELNTILNNEAQNYSEVLANAPKLSYSDPRDRPGQGENIAVRCSDDGSILSAKEAVIYWYNKACKDEKDPSHFSSEITQFAQLVWKNTNYLGMGRATKKKGDLLCTYIVARYSPQATKDGFTENVPQFDSRKICINKCIKDSDHVSVSNSELPSINKFELDEKDKFLSHEAIFNKMKDITEEDRQRLQTRSEEGIHQEKQIDHLPTEMHQDTSFASDYGKLSHENVNNQEVNLEVQKSSKSAEYPLVIHSSASKRNPVKVPNKLFTVRSKAEDDLDLEDDDLKKPSHNENVLDLSSPKRHRHKGIPFSNLSHSSLINGDETDLAHPNNINIHHQSPLKERAHEMESEREDQEKDESDVEHDRYVEKMQRHYERIQSQANEQKIKDRNRGAAFMERFLSPDTNGGSPSFEASSSTWREPKKKRKRRKKKYDDEDDDNDESSEQKDKDENQEKNNKKFEDSEDKESEDNENKDVDASSRVFGKKVKNLVDSEVSEYDASGKLIAKSVDLDKMKPSHLKFSEFKSGKKNQHREEGTLVNPHAPEQLSWNADINSKVSNTEIVNLKSGKLDNSNTATSTHEKTSSKQDIKESSVSHLNNPPNPPKDSNTPLTLSINHITQNEKSLKENTSKALLKVEPAISPNLKENFLKTVLKTEKLSTDLIKSQPSLHAATLPVGTINSTLSLNNDSIKVLTNSAASSQLKTSSNLNTVHHEKSVQLTNLNNTAKVDQAKSIKMNVKISEQLEKMSGQSDKLSSQSEKMPSQSSEKIQADYNKISLSKKLEKLEPPKRLLHNELNLESLDSEPKFEKGSDAEIQYKINKKVSKVQSLNDDKEDSVDFFNKLKTDFVKVKTEMKLPMKKKKNEDLKTVAHFEDIGEENHENIESNDESTFQHESPLALAEKTLNEINNTIVKSELESKDKSVLRESTVTPVAFIQPSTEGIASIPQDVHKSLKKPEIAFKINNITVKNELESKASSVIRESALMPVTFIQPASVTDSNVRDPQVVHKSSPEKPDVMVIINNVQNKTLQRSFSHKLPRQDPEEEDLPVFQEVTDTRIPNNEEADIHELSRSSRMKPTRPVRRTVPGLRISNLTNNGLVDLMFLEKASPKTSDPATRHVLQTFFDSVGLKLNGESTSYIQLIPTKDLDEFRKEMVEQHNKFRSIHLVKPLHLDKSLSKDAQSYAAYVAKHNSVAHSDPKDRPDIGESVAEMCTKEGVLPTAEHIVSKWYSEICNPGFDFKNVSKQPGTGHFTQIIWKDTDKLGIGLAVANHPNGDSCSYVVARYKSAGNYLDKIKENVLEGYFSREKCNALESNVFSRNILARASHLPIPGAVRTMKDHTQKHSVKGKYNKKKKEKDLVDHSTPIKNLEINEPKQFSSINQVPANTPQKLTVLTNKKTDVDFEVREDTDEEPQSKSKILRHSKNETDLDKKSQIYSTNQSFAIYKKTHIQKEFRGSEGAYQYNYKNFWNDEKREKRSNEKNISVNIAKKQDFIYPDFSQGGEFSASTPVHSFIINSKGAVFPLPNAQSVGQFDANKNPLAPNLEYSRPIQNVVQNILAQPPVQQNNLVANSLGSMSSITPLSSNTNYLDLLKQSNKNQDNSFLLSQLNLNHKAINHPTQLNNIIQSELAKQTGLLKKPDEQQVLAALNENLLNNKVMDSSSDLVRQKLVLPKFGKSSEDNLGVPLCMLPAIDAKEALELSSKNFNNRTLPRAIMKLCNNSFLNRLKFLNQFKNGENGDVAKKFIVPKSRIPYRLQSVGLSKKDAEDEVNKYFQHSKKSKQNNLIVYKNPQKSTKLLTKSYAKVFKKQDKTFKDKNSIKYQKPSFEENKKYNNKSDLENYLGNIVVKLHDLNSGKNADTYQTKKSNVKTQSQLEPKSSRKSAIDASIKPENSITDTGHKRLLQSQENIEAKQFDSAYSSMPHEIGIEQMHENTHIEEVSANTNSGSYTATELEVNDKQFPSNSQETLVNEHDTELYGLNSEQNAGWKGEQDVEQNARWKGEQGGEKDLEETFNNNFGSSTQKTLPVEKSETSITASMQELDHSQSLSNKEEEKISSDNSVQASTEDESALATKFKMTPKTVDVPNIKPLQTYSKELEKEVQRIPTEEIKDSNIEANVVAHHIANSFNWDILNTPTHRKKVKSHDLNSHDAKQDSKQKSLHVFDSNLILDRNQRNVRSGKNKIENRSLEQVFDADEKENKIENLEEQKNGLQNYKITSDYQKPYNKENIKSYLALRHFKEYQLKKLKDVHEKQLLKAKLNKKIEEKELKKFSEDFLKEATKLMKESSSKEKKKKLKLSKLDNAKMKYKESDDSELDSNIEPIANSSKNKPEKIEKEFGNLEDKIKVVDPSLADLDHTSFLPDDEIFLRPQNPSIVEQSALMAINQLRAIHLAPKLHLSEKLSRDAQLYANELVQRHGGVLINSPILTRLDQGENLAIDCDPHDKLMSGSEAVVKWYKELCEKGYNFNEEPTADQALGTLHFTQMVWQSTKIFGIGIVTTKKNKMTCTIVVARFHPPGNIPKRFKKNVIEGLFDGKICASIKKISDASDSIVDHTAPYSSQIKSDQYIKHPHKSKNEKSLFGQPKFDTKELGNFVNKTSNDFSENFDEEHMNVKASLEEDDEKNVKFERANEHPLYQKVLQQINEIEQQKKVAKYYSAPDIAMATENYKPKVIANDQQITEDINIPLYSESAAKDFVSIRGLIGKSNSSLEALETPLHLKGSPLDELDDEPKLKFIRADEKGGDVEDMMRSNSRALMKEDFIHKNISGDADVSELLWNKDEGGHDHSFVRSNHRMKGFHQSVDLPSEHEIGYVSKIQDDNDLSENEKQTKVLHNEINSDTQNLENSTHNEVSKDEEESAILNKYLTNKLKMHNYKAIQIGEHLILHTLGNSSIENLNNKISSKVKEEKMSLPNEDKEKTNLSNEDKENMSLSNEDKENISLSNVDKEKMSLSNEDKEKMNFSNEDKEKMSLSNEDKEKMSLSNEDKEKMSLSNEDKENMSLSNEDKEKMILSNKVDEKMSLSNEENEKMSNKEEESLSNKEKEKIRLSNKKKKKLSSKLANGNDRFMLNTDQEKVEIKKYDNEEKKPDSKKLNALNEQNEGEKKPEDLIYESSSLKNSRKKLNHLDQSHYEHPQNKKLGNRLEDQPTFEENNEGSKTLNANNKNKEQVQTVKKPPNRKPPKGLKGHGEEEQPEDNKLVAGNEMLGNDENKRPSKRPTHGSDLYKPILSPSPTPLVIPSPSPMSSSFDAKLVQTLGPWPSVSFSSFGSPVVLHIGATGFYEDDLAFLRIGLSTHNKLRKIHGSPPMEMDQELTAKAYRHAVSLTNLGYLKHESLKQNPTLELLPGVISTVGENLFLGCYDGEYDISAEEAVVRWYGEVCSPGHCFNKTSQCSGTGHFSQVVWASSVRLGMAKATRMQNGLRCTYIVAKYFPEGNNHMLYNENVLKGNFNEKETCHDVIEALVTFETRNIDKANMVAKEKNLARMEFLKSLKDAEKQVTENLNKELATGNVQLYNSSCCGLMLNDLDQIKENLPVNAGGTGSEINNVQQISQDHFEELKNSNPAPILNSKFALKTQKAIRNDGLQDSRQELFRGQKYMNSSFITSSKNKNSVSEMNPIREAKVSYENEILNVKDPNLEQNSVSQHSDDEMEANGVTKSDSGLDKEGVSSFTPSEINDLDITTARNKLHTKKQAEVSLDQDINLIQQSENKSKPVKKKENESNLEKLVHNQKKNKKLSLGNTRVDGVSSDDFDDEEKIRPQLQSKHDPLESTIFPTLRKTQKSVSKKKPAIVANREDSIDAESGDSDENISQKKVESRFKKISGQNLPTVNINVPGGPNDPTAKLEDMAAASHTAETEYKPSSISKPVLDEKVNNHNKTVKVVLSYKDRLQNLLKMTNLKNSSLNLLTQDLSKDMHHVFETSTNVASGMIWNKLKNPIIDSLVPSEINPEDSIQKPSVYQHFNSESHTLTNKLKWNDEENKQKPYLTDNINITDIHQYDDDRFISDSDDLSSPTISVKVECKISSENPDQAAPYLLSTKCGSENEKAFHGPMTGDVSLFQLSALNAHNAYRHAHNAPSLVLNAQMSKEATEYAKKIAEAASLSHSNTEDGENIATVCRSKDELMTGQEASTIWYREVCDPGYDFSAAVPGKAGHFTQVVWKTSRQFGIGRASKFHNGLLCTYVVARYRPAGNFIGEFAANVLQGHFRSPRECLNLARKRSGIRFPRSFKEEKRNISYSKDNYYYKKNLYANNTKNESSYDKGRKISGKKLVSGYFGIFLPTNVSSNEVSKELESQSTENQLEISLNTPLAGDFLLDNQVSEFELTSLKLHNLFRSVHLSPPLGLDNNLTFEAKKRADFIAGKDIKSKILSLENENVVETCKDSGELLTATDAVTSWYNTVCSPSYIFGVDWVQEESAPFTQLVWKESTHLGIARTNFYKNKKRCSVVVAKYSQRKNKNAFKSNVFQGDFDTKSYCDGLGAVYPGVVHQNNPLVETDLPKRLVPLDTQDFRQEALSLHNKFRMIHGSPAIKLDEDLCIEAEMYASILATEGVLKHSNTKYGENYAKSCSKNETLTGDEAVRTWYNEVCNPGYIFAHEPPKVGTESFAQMIWKETSKMGIGRANSEENGMYCTYVVSRYNKRAMPNQHNKSVLKGKFDFGYCGSLGRPSHKTNIRDKSDGLRRTINHNIMPSRRYFKHYQRRFRGVKYSDGNNFLTINKRGHKNFERR